MKKRIIPILIVLAALIGLLMLPANAAETSNGIQAGYAKITIDPSQRQEGAITLLPMGGYGAEAQHLSGLKYYQQSYNSTSRTYTYKEVDNPYPNNIQYTHIDDNGDGKINTEDGLFASCIAMIDKDGNTILYIAVDLINSSANWTNPLRRQLSDATGVPYDNIYINASHTHSGPAITYGYNFNEEKLAADEVAQRAKVYREWVYEQIIIASKDALTNCEPVSVTKGSIVASDYLESTGKSGNQLRMNHVRHYITDDGTGNYYYGGSNFGEFGATSKMVYTPDDTLYLLKFTPTNSSNAPIVIVNWRAHATMNSTLQTTYGKRNHYRISSDYVGSLRATLENANYRFAFMQGAAGNAVPNSAIEAQQDPDVCGTYKTSLYNNPSYRLDYPMGSKYGAKLGEIALDGLNNMENNTALNTSFIRTVTTNFTYDKQVLTDDQAALVAMLNVESGDLYNYFDEATSISFPRSGVTKDTPLAFMSYNQGNFNAGKALVTAYKNAGKTVDATGYAMLDRIGNYRELSGYSGNKSIKDGSTGSFTVGAIAIGPELSFVVAPAELFDYYTDNTSAYTYNDWADLTSSKTGTGSYGTPLMMGYTNGGVGYVPNTAAYHYNESYLDPETGALEFNAGCYESFGADFGEGTGEQLMAQYVKLLKAVNTESQEENIPQCECGGKATNGKYGHVCSDVVFRPWTATDYLPTGGNYYLTKDVTTTVETAVSSDLRLDLRGKTITRYVSEEQGDLAITDKASGYKDQTHNTRVFTLSGTARMTITDSTNNPGTIKRDLSDLNDTQKNSMGNYGQLLLINGTSSAVLYDGILDSTGTLTRGGGCIDVHAESAHFAMYGGRMKGGSASDGGVMRVAGNAEFYGGNVTGGTTPENGSLCAGIWVTTTGTVTIGGDVVIQGNQKKNTVNTNIRYQTQANMETNFTVSGEFTGKVGVFISDKTYGKPIGISDNASFTTDNLVLDYEPDGFVIAAKGEDIVLLNESDIRKQCECGGKAKDMTGHTCKKIDFVPWTDATSLPTHGNYYLTTNVTLADQLDIDGNLRLDLNGKTITRTVISTTNPRVFAVNDGDYLSITDTSDTPGSVKRDVSNLSGTVTNWGLIVLVTKGGNATLYNGHLDSTGGHTTGGGGCISSNEAGANFTMYGGKLTGCEVGDAATTDGIAYYKSGQGGVLYNAGTTTIYGGEITGGIADMGGFAYNYGDLYLFGGEIHSNRTANNGTCPGVYTVDNGKLTIGGNAVLRNNRKYWADGTGMSSYLDIRFGTESKMATNFTVKGVFTGRTNVYVSSTNHVAGFTLGKSDNASFTSGNLYDTFYSALLDIKVVGNTIQFATPVAYTARVEVPTQNGGIAATDYETLADAIKAYTGNGAAMKLLADSSENVTFTKDTVLDLNGYDLTGTVKANGKLTVKDSQTDDLTVKDGKYGKVPASLSADAAEGYVKITESDGTSFHRLILDTVGITLRSSTTGMYYTSDFGGDEVIKRNIKSFGVALGANKAPDFREKTYTAFSGDSWAVGKNSDGSTKNRSNGTILQGILAPDNGFSTNMIHSEIKVFGAAYIELLNGDRVVEDDTVKFSLRDMVEGYDGFDGADDLWFTLSDTQKDEAIALYETYTKVMKSWNIPNIKQALIDGQDDGVLKILMIGHSLGMDSTYFVPDVIKNETGQDVVIGTLYHSGCRLNQHVGYINNSSKEYAYLEYDTTLTGTTTNVIDGDGTAVPLNDRWRIWSTGADANYEEGFWIHDPNPNDGHDYYIGANAARNGNPNRYGVTMQFGIQQHDWDIVVMQAGVFEAGNVNDSPSSYALQIASDIKTIQNYVKANDANKFTAPKFAWNMTWATPSIESGRLNTSYKNNLNSLFGGDHIAMYNAISETLTDVVLTTYDWEYVFPSGTVVENARTVYTGTNETKIYRDTIHGTDLTRMMVAYGWYCTLFDKDIVDCKLSDIPAHLRFYKADRTSDFSLTDEQRSHVRNSVNNAINNPYKVTEASDDGILKVLVVGHSTGMDPIYFVPEIAEANGVNMIVGDLYHSGCKLSQHESFIKNNREAYVYLEYDNTSDKNYWEIWQTGVDKVKDNGTVEVLDEGFAQHFPNQAHDSWYYGSGMTMLSNSYGVTMQWAIQQHDWDIVIMMGGRLETTDVFTDGEPLDITDIGIIRDYILANDKDKTTVPAFAWNTLWTNPEYDEAWIATLSSNFQTSYNRNWAAVEKYYENSTYCLYEHLVAGLKNYILPNYNFDYLLHNNTVIQNAKAMGVKEGLTASQINTELYRDYTHASDFARMMTAANWYCGITGTDIDDLVIPSIPATLTYSKTDTTPLTLTSDQISKIRTCVGNAIENPYEVTK